MMLSTVVIASSGEIHLGIKNQQVKKNRAQVSTITITPKSRTPLPFPATFLVHPLPSRLLENVHPAPVP